MRPDLLQGRKCVHVKLDKSVHAALRAALFKRGLSMQEVFDDYANLVTNEDARVIRLLDQLGLRKVQERLAGVSRRGTTRPIGDLDTDGLYSLIEKSKGETQ